jgi:UDP-3-O-[3-hydroxymyristoyl] N-acetylglucosamine deacetylase/3-hydroxyacyl-[acyl-carrier-protein] dehydratase
LVFSLHLVTPIRRGICHMRGVAYVNNKPVMEGEMMAQIVKVKGHEVKTAETQLA